MRGIARRGERPRRCAACSRGQARRGTHEAGGAAGRDVAARRTERHRARVPRHASGRSAADSAGRAERSSSGGPASPFGVPRRARAERPADEPRGDPPRAASEWIRHRFTPSREAFGRRARLRDRQRSGAPGAPRRLRARLPEPGRTTSHRIPPGVTRARRPPVPTSALGTTASGPTKRGRQCGRRTASPSPRAARR